VAVEMVPLVAEIVTRVVVETPTVRTVNCAVLAPAGTVTDVGTVANRVFELDRVTTIPPVGAFPLNVTVARELRPPISVDGNRLSDCACGAAMVRLEDALVPKVPVMVETV
jgi:hypothetical protein